MGLHVSGVSPQWKALNVREFRSRGKKGPQPPPVRTHPVVGGSRDRLDDGLDFARIALPGDSLALARAPSRRVQAGPLPQAPCLTKRSGGVLAGFGWLMGHPRSRSSPGWVVPTRACASARDGPATAVVVLVDPGLPLGEARGAERPQIARPRLAVHDPLRQTLADGR